MTSRSQLSWLLVAVLAVACAEPPHKEMDQAQGAIDAARAAGAERFAPDEFAAATTALDSANTAVTARDYRLALNHALESLEQAQSAAREAATARARLRGELERSMAELTARLTQARTRLDAASSTRASVRALEGARDELTAAEQALQEAGEAIDGDAYEKAEAALITLRAHLEKLGEMLDAATSQSPRRRGSQGTRIPTTGQPD